MKRIVKIFILSLFLFSVIFCEEKEGLKNSDMAKKLAFLPGAGQFYNNKYLKGTVLLLTEAYSLYQIDKFSKLAIISQRNSFIWLAIITYAYSFIDAHVDAELSSFPDRDNVLNEEK